MKGMKTGGRCRRGNHSECVRRGRCPSEEEAEASSVEEEEEEDKEEEEEEKEEEEEEEEEENEEDDEDNLISFSSAANCWVSAAMYASPSASMVASSVAAEA